MPKKFPEESVRPILVAYFHIGRLWSKMMSISVPEKIRDVTNSLENYKVSFFFIDYNRDFGTVFTMALRSVLRCIYKF